MKKEKEKEDITCNTVVDGVYNEILSVRKKIFNSLERDEGSHLLF